MRMTTAAPFVLVREDRDRETDACINTFVLMMKTVGMSFCDIDSIIIDAMVLKWDIEWGTKANNVSSVFPHHYNRIIDMSALP